MNGSLFLDEPECTPQGGNGESLIESLGVGMRGVEGAGRVCGTQGSAKYLFRGPKFGSGQEVCFCPSRPDPGRNAREQDGTRTGRDGPPPSGHGWVRNTVKQSTLRIWTGPPRTRDGTWTGPG